MWLCYLMVGFVLVVGLFFWLISKRIAFWEWGLSFLAAVLVVTITHAIMISGMTGDTETWSGQIQTAGFAPEWVEKYRVAIYKTVTHHKTRTVGVGKHRHTEHYTEEERVFDHYEDRYRTHPDEWWAVDSLSGQFSIDSGFYGAIKKEFGSEKERDGLKGGFYSGNPHTYFAVNATGYIYPTTATRSWENRVKAAPSVFSYSKVPEGAPVFDYPAATDGYRTSDRLKGRAKTDVSPLEWDRMNSRLGPIKKVNVIACGFGEDAGMDLGHLQEAKYCGGKKNDLVICYGGINVGGKPSWVYVFGWTEKFDCKRNLESVVLEGGFNAKTLPEIEKEISANYQIKDWHKFDYLTVEPPPSAYVWLVLAIILTQGGYWTWAFLNQTDKEGREKCVNSAP